MSDNIAGGLGDNRPDADFDADQLQAGIEVEMEHTNEPDIAKEIAKDHLTEDPLYYERLALVEVSKAWSLHDAGKWLADKWSALENRYGRRAALTMAVAMLATLPLPGNIAAIVGIAEGIRGMVAKSIKKGTLYKTDASERSATFVLSTEATDRDGETVNPEGGNFDDYAKNPVVAFNHNTDDFPIGTSGTPDGKVAIWVEEVEVDGKRKPALLGKCFFSEANPKGQLAFDMVEEGTLRGCSISFLPIGQPSKNANGGNHYEQWKLLEWSICPIGSNADAVKLSKRLKSANKSVVIQHRDGQRYWSDARKDWVPSLGSPTMYRSVADASAAVIGNDLDDYVLRQWGKALGGPPP